MKAEGGQRRSYRMVARAKAFEATGERIVNAAASLFGTMLYDQVSLDRVAHQAGTTVQTIIRRFGSKEQLFAEVARRRRNQIHGERDRVEAGDVDGALTVLLSHYERWGDEVLLLLAQEGRNLPIAEIVESGRRFHHNWVRRVFGPVFEDVPAEGRQRALQQLGAITDIYVWKIFRRDLGLDPDQTKVAVTGMLDGITASLRGAR